MNECMIAQGLGTIADARAAVRSFVAQARSSDGLLDEILNSGQDFLDECWLPPPGGDPNSFLALHFDFGHALFPLVPADVHLFVALYLPPSSAGASAATRVVRIEDIRSQRRWGSRANIEERLWSYASSHGSSWDWDGDSGNRTSCFARVLDALCPPHRLTDFRTTSPERWYEVSHAGHEFGALFDEAAFYGSCGVALEPIEQHLVLQPGQLLVLNNVRAVHGRYGSRRPEELYQFLLGVRRVHPEKAVLIRDWLTTVLGDA